LQWLAQSQATGCLKRSYGSFAVVVTGEWFWLIRNVLLTLRSFFQATIEVKGVHQMQWLTQSKAPVLDLMENSLALQKLNYGDRILEEAANDPPQVRFPSLYNPHYFAGGHPHSVCGCLSYSSFLHEEVSLVPSIGPE
jgi:hypothetical protein